VLPLLLWFVTLALSAAAQDRTSLSPDARAVAYLATEVPKWRRDHDCYSCHNNGDAVRALLAAVRAGHDVGRALDDTLAWLGAPERWDQNARRGGSEELPLARIQFGGALASMVDAGRASQDSLDRAAALVVPHQQADGAWRLNASQILGGPTSYGTALATASARSVLARASTPAASAARARADLWLRAVDVATVLDASSILIGLDDGRDKEAVAQRARALGLLRRGQGPDGGWGPYVNSQAEAFDTALAVLALSNIRADSAGGVYSAAERLEAIDRGRRYLISSQEDDGSWLETTRPPGLESYAQRISTTAWSLLALLESGPTSR
jgi:hypothetical protein